MIALTLTYLYPENIQAIVLIDSSYKPPYVSKIITDHKVLEHFVFLIGKYLPGFYIQGPVNYEKFVGSSDFDKKRIFSDLMHTSLKSYLLISKNILNFDGRKLLDAIGVPTLVIQGTEDTVFPPNIAKYLNARIKKSELDLIKGANHILIFTKPTEITDSILRFLYKIST